MEIYPDPSTYIFIGDEIMFHVPEVDDTDDDRLTYIWDFGDGSRTEGNNVSHTYSKKGFKTVSMWVSDGTLESEKINQRIEILEEGHSYKDDRDYYGVENSLDAFPDDGAASVDTDGDGYPDRWNDGRDMDDSQTGLKIDNYPEDPERNGYEVEKNNGEMILLILILSSLIIIVILIVVMILVVLDEKRKGKSLTNNRITKPSWAGGPSRMNENSK
jgi:hypothetical protein